MSRSLSLLVVLGSLTLSLTGLSPFTRLAHADGWASMKGKVVISDAAFGTGYAVRRADGGGRAQAGKPTLKGDAAAWTMNLMVFLKEPPNATSINIVYYDVSAQPREQVNFSEVRSRPRRRS